LISDKDLLEGVKMNAQSMIGQKSKVLCKLT